MLKFKSLFVNSFVKSVDKISKNQVQVTFRKKILENRVLNGDEIASFKQILQVLKLPTFFGEGFLLWTLKHFYFLGIFNKLSTKRKNL